MGERFRRYFKDYADGLSGGEFVDRIKAFIKHLGGLFQRDQVDGEVAEELRLHIEMHIDENIRMGMTQEQALKDAVQRFGSFEDVRQTCREIRGAGLLEGFVQDVHFGGRMLVKSREITLAAILALGLGIGATTSIFSLVNTLLLRPLPFKDPARLMWITQSLPRFNAQIVTGADFLEWAKQKQLFEGIGAFSSGSLNLTGVKEPDRVSAGQVSFDFFPLLGVEPLYGRIFSQEEDQPGRASVVLLSYELWQRKFGGTPSVIGRTVILDEKPCTVIGVIPRDFRIFGRYDVWMPLALDPVAELARKRMSIVYAVARLRPQVTEEQARAGLTVIDRRLEKEYPQGYKGVQVRILPLHERLVGQVRLSLLILLGAVGFLLLIACVNVANLLLARGHAREKEIALRGALGASRLRLVRQFITESVLLAFLGGTAGLVLSFWGMRVMAGLVPADTPGGSQIGMDPHVLVFSMLISLATGVTFGLAPALATSKPDLNSLLKGIGDSAQTLRGHFSFRSALTVCEVALTTVLMIGAGLMVRSFLKVRDVNPGFDAVNVLTMAVKLPRSTYPQPSQQAEFIRQALARIRTLPGVDFAGTTSQLPLSQGSGDQSFFSREGEGSWPAGESAEHMVNQVWVNPEYFQAMGISLVKGEGFTSRDIQKDTSKILINETLARRFFANADPIGRRVKLNFPEAEAPWLAIEGVVGDVRQQRLEDEPHPSIYIPYPRAGFLGSPWLAVRASTQPITLAGEIRAELSSIDRNVPAYDIMTMQERVETSEAARRLKTGLFATFALIGLGLAAVGIYGVMSFSVTRRTHEIGIRVALGARVKDVMWMILREAVALVALGIAVGLLGAFILTRLLSNLLYAVPSTDWVTFAASSLFLIGAGLLASFLPARHAAAVDPMEALRHN